MKLDARTAPIHAVLENYLKPKDLAYALRLWSEQFIGQPNLSLKMFVESFYSRQPMELRSHELYNELLPAMLEAFRARVKFTGELIDPYEYPDYDFDELVVSQSRSTEVLPKKEPIQTRPKAIPTAPVEQATLVKRVIAEPVEKVEVESEPIQLPRVERYEVFSLFMRTLCSKIPADRRDKLFASYGREIRECCIYPIGDSFFNWLISDADYFEDAGLDTETMSSITHTLYMGMCDYLGPVAADGALTFASSVVVSKYPQAELDLNKLL